MFRTLTLYWRLRGRYVRKVGEGFDVWGEEIFLHDFFEHGLLEEVMEEMQLLPNQEPYSSGDRANYRVEAAVDVVAAFLRGQGCPSKKDVFLSSLDDIEIVFLWDSLTSRVPKEVVRVYRYAYEHRKVARVWWRLHTVL